MSSQQNPSTPSTTTPHQKDASLSPRVQRFVAEYLRDFNGTQAAIRAGYSPKSARSQASHMLRNVAIAAAVREAGERALKSSEALLARVKYELALMAFFDPLSVMGENGRLLPLEQIS